MEPLLQLLIFVGIFVCSAALTFIFGGFVALLSGVVRDNSFSSENIAAVAVCAWIMALVMVGFIGTDRFSDSSASSEEVVIETTVEAAE